MRCIFLLTLLFGNSIIFAQTNLRFSKLMYEEDKNLGWSGGIVNSLVYDNEYIYFSLSGIYFAHTTIIRAINYKMDEDGNILKKAIDTIAGHSTINDFVAESRDKKYLFWVGMTYDYNKRDNNTDFIITKTDKDLNKIWKKRITNPGFNAAKGYSVIEQEDGTLMILATRIRDGSPNKNHVLKLDSLGNLIWRKTPGGGYYDNCKAMIQSDDGNLLIAGWTFSWGNTNGAPYVLKIDTAGNELWHQTFAKNNYTTWLLDIKRTNEIEETYIGVGVTVPEHNGEPYGDSRGYVVKFDKKGNIIIEKEIEWEFYSEEFFAVSKANDNSFYICGSTRNKKSNDNLGWIVKIDENLNVLWNRLIPNIYPSSSFNSSTYLYNITSLKDNSIITAGSTRAPNKQGDRMQYGWVVKLDSLGCLTEECVRAQEPIQPNYDESGFVIYPNPNTGIFNIKSKRNFLKGTTAYITDVLGRKIMELPSPEEKYFITYDISHLASGVYFLKIKTIEKETVKKLVLINEKE